MKTISLAIAGALAALVPVAATAEWRPLSQQAINNATLDGWRASVREAEAVADAAEADPTMPQVEPGEEGSRVDTVGRAITEATERAAAEGIDMPKVPDVPVSNGEGMTIASPSYSTDSPEEAGLENVDDVERPDPFLVRLQVLLARANVSPGAIDGLEGENTRKAIRAFEAMHGLPQDGEIDADTFAALDADATPAITTYQISEDDLARRYVEHLPDDYAALAELEWLGYSSPSEMLAERFHMDEALLVELNPTADFKAAGTTILVADVGAGPELKVANIVVDGNAGQLTAYDGNGNVVFVAPATVGSDDTPSPSGTTTVEAVAPEPTYSYDPKNFTQGSNHEPLTLPAGPNGPVGSVWIDLSKPTYGIHGTSDPSLIAKSASHGCVRLTNWDAEALSKLVQPRLTTVKFLPKRGV